MFWRIPTQKVLSNAFAVMGKIAGGLFCIKSEVWNSSLLLWKKSVGTGIYGNIQCMF